MGCAQSQTKVCQQQDAQLLKSASPQPSVNAAPAQQQWQEGGPHPTVGDYEKLAQLRQQLAVANSGKPAVVEATAALAAGRDSDTPSPPADEPPADPVAGPPLALPPDGTIVRSPTLAAVRGGAAEIAGCATTSIKPHVSVKPTRLEWVVQNAGEQLRQTVVIKNQSAATAICYRFKTSRPGRYYLKPVRRSCKMHVSFGTVMLS